MDLQQRGPFDVRCVRPHKESPQFQVVSPRFDPIAPRPDLSNESAGGCGAMLKNFLTKKLFERLAGKAVV